MTTLKETLMQELHSQDTARGRSKITIVGAGQVGMACTVSILQAGISDELAIIDTAENKLKREAAELQYGGLFQKAPKITADTDYSITAGSKLCIVTVGVCQEEGESKTSLMQRNIQAFKCIVANLAKHSNDATLIIVSNPVDVLTYVAWKLSGFPSHRVIGIGTSLESARFRFLLSEKLQINPSSIHGYIIGEHGESSVAVWSGTNVAGISLQDLNPDLSNDEDVDGRKQIHLHIIDSAVEARKMKENAPWALGISVANLAQAVLKNLRTIHTVSTFVKGIHGIEEDIFLSLPCILSSSGVSGILRQPLTEAELQQLRRSAAALWKTIKKFEL
ncbi:L-lactate dehydrogenase B chain-like isoform X3 [Ambystoma mexicanum]|uniref:L-lactate dehydrogenase B chain-like isoform X3 n=1 Tax=Ambystoma mexicanum TaxID=8296 RepID=UPI0037E941CF